ncbi:MAG: hypothetical protein AAF959_18465 [Cyanobacteria bacterium P01_D01_bin.56]
MKNIQASEYGQPINVQFVQIQVALHGTGPDLRDCIEARLGEHGQPLRWAITAVDSTTARVEAIVTRAEIN